ncbi:hypothetical protein ACFY97_02700 [Streptomyces klenkii]|uniref:hypothetical protein n=1 Tax=Streptomyces klenkii TaxID=1420899 RepID=UPI0036E47FA9
MSRGNRYFTPDGYYRGPGAGIGALLLLAVIIYAVTHPDVVDHILETIRQKALETSTPPALPSDSPSP